MNPPPDHPSAGLDAGLDQSTFAEPTWIVGVGASAGGLEALEQFFSAMPSDTRMAFVVVQHLSPDFKSLMDELLARHTKIPIQRVEESTRVEANAIYLIPPRKIMTLSYGKLLLTDADDSGGLNLPIDKFFTSLAQDAGRRAIAVVLSGTGSDGSRGIRDVHEAGGLVVVQDVESAAFDGMPRSAVATGMADIVTTPEKMAEDLCRYAADPENFIRDREAHTEPIEPGDEMTVLFRLFRNRYGIDFANYRRNTIQRRIERRLRLVNCHDLSTYVSMLESDMGELDALYRDLLVEVTQFFRDLPAFRKLRQEVIPSIVERATKPNDEIRAWVPGCATGEEAYSIAMLIDDCARTLGLRPRVKLFATDVHNSSLETGSSGVYPADAVSNVPDDLLSRYFTQHGSVFHVTRELRQMVIFAPHDITKDPPFTRIDLISCRNVLIYLEPVTQRRVISLFHFGMRVGGVMMLGPSESVGDLQREFESVDQHWRIFRKLRDVRLPDASTITHSPTLTSIVRTRKEFPGVAQLATYPDETDVMADLIERYAPPSFLVNDHFELVHSFGDASRLLVQPRGRPTLEILKLVSGNLRIAMSAALHRSAREQEKVVLDGIRVPLDDAEHFYRVSVEPYVKRKEALYLVSLEEMQTHASAPEDAIEVFRADDQASQRIVDLEKELDFTKQSLQTTVEELESSNEEMQSTNEELVASNEELQSTNEELHSVNEELHTVNAEHQRKIAELTQLTADMDNLLRSTDIGTIFLDSELRIRKFTPAIKNAFNIMEQDTGRPIDQFAYNLDNPELLDDAREVAATGKPIEREVQTHDGTRTYLKRILPYRKANGEAEGVVITFTDVASLTSRAEADLREREARHRQLLDSLREGIYGLDTDGNCTFCNPECLRLLGYESEEDLLGRNMHQLIHHTRVDGSAYPMDECHIYESFRKGRNVHCDDEVLWRANGTSFPAEYRAHPIIRDGKVLGAVMSFLDISERLGLRQAEAELRFAHAASGIVGSQELPGAAAVVHVSESVDSVLQEALFSLARQARLIVGAHQAALSYIPQGDFLSAVHSHSFSRKYEPYNDYDIMPTGEGIWRVIIESRKPIRLSHDQLVSHPGWRNFSGMKTDEGLEHPPMRGWLAAPILGAHSEFLGVIQLTDKLEGDFTEKDLQLLVRLSQLIAPTFAVEYARREQELRTGTISEDLDGFSVSMPEGLGAALQCLEQLRGEEGSIAEDDVTRLDAASDDLRLLVDSFECLRKYSSADRWTGPTEILDLGELLREAQKTAGDTIGTSHLAIEVNEPLPVTVTGRDPLAVVLNNIVINLAAWAKPDASPRVTISAYTAKGQNRLTFRLDGSDIADRHLREIVSSAECPNASARKTIPGLALARRGIEHIGGEMSLSRESETSCTITLTLPG